MVTDAHPTPKPGAYWPPGFKERAEAHARRIAAEDRARAACSCSCHDSARLAVKAALAALASIALTAVLLVALVGCSPATTRALCDTSTVVLDSAQPASSAGKLAASVGRFVRAMFCPRTSGATDRLPAIVGAAEPRPLDGPDQRVRLTAAQ